MIQRVWEQTKKAKKLNEVLVATDSEEIFALMTKLGGKAVLTDTNLSSGTDRIGAAIKDNDADVVVNIQGDEPAIDPLTIDALVDCIIQNPDIDVATPAVPIYNPDELYQPTAVKVVTDKNRNALYFSRAPIPYPRNEPMKNQPYALLHIGVYAYRRRALEWFCKQSPSELELREGLEQLRFLENNWKIRVLFTNSISIGVDTPEDIDKVIELLKQRNIL